MAKVLVTGAGGFIGSHLCEALVRRGDRVRAFVHYGSDGSWGWLDESPLAKEMEVVAGDLRDFDSVFSAAKGMDQIYHLGALIGIPYSYRSPLAYVRTNVEGTYNVLEASRHSGTAQVLVTSTSEVYGSARYVPIDEAHPLQPQSPYSATKIAADSLALSYHHSFQTPVVVARPFNTFGPRQSARAVIPTVALQLIAKLPALSLGNLAPSRDLTYVEDTASGLIAIANESRFLGQTVNIGTGQSVSVGDLVELLSQIIGHKAEVRTDPERVRPEASEVARLLSKNELLTRTTGWKPKFTIEEGLRKTVEWLKSNSHRYKTNVYNV